MLSGGSASGACSCCPDRSRHWSLRSGRRIISPPALTRLGPGEVNRELSWTELTHQQQDFQAAKMAVHAAMVDRMDQEIGRLLKQLRVIDAYDTTVIFFLSDNGASAEIMIRGDGHDPAAPNRGPRRVIYVSGRDGRARPTRPFVGTRRGSTRAELRRLSSCTGRVVSRRKVQ